MIINQRKRLLLAREALQRLPHRRLHRRL
jgi:hypothetical protein